VSFPSLWRKCVQQPALWLLCLPAGRLLRTTAVVTLLYVLSPWVPQSWIWWLECGVAVLLFAAFSDPSAAGTAALTLARRVQFGIRRSYLHRRAHPIMLNAGLKKPTTSNLTLHGPSQYETPPVIKRLTRQTKYGMTLVFDGSKQGYDDWDFDKVAHTLKSKFSGTLLKGRIKLLGSCKDLFIEPDKRVEHFIRCDIIYIDPFATVITTDMLPPPSSPDYVVKGLDERGRGVEQSFRLSQLISGESDSGKSTNVRMQLLGQVRSGNAFLVMAFDPKKQEYVDIKDKAWYYQGDRDIHGFLKRCLQVLEQRQQDMAALGLTDYPSNDSRLPRIFMLFDELITALAAQDKKDRSIKFDGGSYNAEGAFMELLSTGRSAGITCIACTQLMNKTILDVLRDLFPYKTYLRQPSIDSTRICFPGENQARMYPAHALAKDGSTAGVGWTEKEGQIIKFRTAKPSAAERQEVADGIERWTKKYLEGGTPTPTANTNRRTRVNA
jgi:hypothetical protein